MNVHIRVLYVLSVNKHNNVVLATVTQNTQQLKQRCCVYWRIVHIIHIYVYSYPDIVFTQHNEDDAPQAFNKNFITIADNSATNNLDEKGVQLLDKCKKYIYIYI
jgi:hypothetical protein